MNNNITIATSRKKTLNLVDIDGKPLGKFTIDPGDIHIVERYADAMTALDELRKQYNISDGDIWAQAEVIKTLEAKTREQFDRLLGYNAAKDLFSKKDALSMNEDGDFYFEQLLIAISTYASGEIEQGYKKKEERRANRLTPEQLEKIEKATAKYEGR